MDFLQACRGFIGIDTTPTQSTEAASLWLREFALRKGLNVELQEEFFQNEKHSNIIIRPKQEKSQPSPAGGAEGASFSDFLLQTHLDTTDPGNYGLWEKTNFNPFDAHIVDGRIHGLGAADVKLDLLCKIEALSQVSMTQESSNQHWRRHPVVVGTFGEESGMVGALKLIRKSKIHPDLALIGEATDMRLATSAKGFALIEIQVPFSPEEVKYRKEHDLLESSSTQSKVFHGVPAHDSNPELGESAVNKLLNYISSLPESYVVMNVEGGVNFNGVPAHAFLELDLVSLPAPTLLGRLKGIHEIMREVEKKFGQYLDESFTPPISTLSVGVIKTHANYVQLLATCRMTPNVPPDVLDEWVESIQLRCEELGAYFQLKDYKRPYQLSSKSEFVQVCQEELDQVLGVRGPLMALSSTNEASLFSRVGVQCVCFGPGEREGNVHTPNEFVRIGDLHRSLDFYKRIIRRFCL